MTIELKGRKAVKGYAAGEALVGKDNVCYVGSVDITSGDFNELGHAFSGQNLKGKVLVYPTGKGSTGGAYCLYAVAKNGFGPAAIINREIEMVTAAGAIIGGVPVVDHLEEDPFDVIETGDWVEVDANNGIVRVTKKQA